MLIERVVVVLPQVARPIAMPDSIAYFFEMFVFFCTTSYTAEQITH